MRTLYNDTLVRPALPLIAAPRTNGTVNGTAVDMGVFNNDFRTVMFAIFAGTVTDGTHAVTVEESADGSTAWTAMPADKILGTLPSLVSGSSNLSFQFGVIPQSKQFLRIVVTTSGATTGGIFTAVAVLGAGTFYPPNRS